MAITLNLALTPSCVRFNLCLLRWICISSCTSGSVQSMMLISVQMPGPCGIVNNSKNVLLIDFGYCCLSQTRYMCGSYYRTSVWGFAHTSSTLSVLWDNYTTREEKKGAMLCLVMEVSPPPPHHHTINFLILPCYWNIYLVNDGVIHYL